MQLDKSNMIDRLKLSDHWLILLISAPWYLYLGREMFFIYDEWNWWRGLVDQPIGSTLLLTPYVDSLNGGLFLIWKFLTLIFGMNYLPYQAVTLAFFGLSVVVVHKMCKSLGLSREMSFLATLYFSFIAPNVGNVLFGWQMAWTAGVALGLGALLIEIQNETRFKSLQATILIALGIFIGPAALPFLVSLLLVCLISRKYVAVLFNLGVATAWLYWKSKFSNSITDGFPLSVFVNGRFGFIENGITSSLGHLWPITVLLTFGILSSRLRSRRQEISGLSKVLNHDEAVALGNTFTSPSKSTLIFLAGFTGLFSWWLMLSAGRSQIAEDAVWANADQFRYQHISCVFLFLCLLPFFSKIKAISRPGATIVLIFLVVAILFSLVSQQNWASPYGNYAQQVEHNLCNPVKPYGEFFFQQEEVSKYVERGWLKCG